MKVSVNWIKEYLSFELPPIDKLVEKIGAQLGGVDEVIDLGARYRGIIVVKVVECAPMPDSDHLSICKVDDDKVAKDVERDANGLVQVVCGAPNIKAGMLVAWLPPGSTVPATAEDVEPFVLSAKPFRGVTSNGMLASAKELAIGDSHEGILELGDKVKPGDDFATAYKLDDYIIDIENKMFTHRPDLFGQIGVAREVAGILGQQFMSADWYAHGLPDMLDAASDELGLEVHNELPALVPRFMAVAISGVDGSMPSSPALQTYLSRVGIRPISMIVDITNYMMVLTGQPLHAYDYDKVKALSGGDKATLTVRNPHPGEKLTLLNGKEIEPRAEAIMIATDQKLIGLGGVMGGADTEVDANTKRIILECANFDMYSIRRSSMAHGIFSDAVTRFNKGQSPLQNHRIMAEAVHLMKQLSDGQAVLASAVIDNNHLDEMVLSRQSLYPAVKVATEFINDRLGLSLSAEEMKALLEYTEFVVNIGGDMLEVTSPFWRTDIELREDVVEEVGRLYGYDKLPLVLPARDLTPAVEDQMLSLKARIRRILADAGANEALTYSFVHGDLLNKARQDSDQAFALSNALSPDLQYYRLSLTPSLLDKVHANIKAGYDQFALFELGKVHATSAVDEHGLPEEFDRLSLVFAADQKASKQYGGAAYFQARKYLMNVVAEFGLMPGLKLRPLAVADLADHQLLEQLSRTYEPNRAAVIYVGDQMVGVVGEYRNSARRLLKLPDYCAGFELFLSVLPDESRSQYVALPRFPKVSQDISLKLPVTISYQEVYDFVWEELGKVQPEQTLPQLGPVDIYQREDDSAHQQITLRLTIASYERTLTDAEVNKLLDTVAAAAQTKYGAERL